MEHIKVVLLDMPTGIKGLTIKNEDDSFTIIINAGLSSAMQVETYDHEIEHINKMDFNYMYNINELEGVRHDCCSLY